MGFSSWEYHNFEREEKEPPGCLRYLIAICLGLFIPFFPGYLVGEAVAVILRVHGSSDDGNVVAVIVDFLLCIAGAIFAVKIVRND